MNYESMSVAEKKDFWRANPLHGQITITVEGLPKFVMASRNDDTVIKELYWTDFKGWERESLRIWAAPAAQFGGGGVLDVGAYTGIYSILAAIMNPETAVLAIDIQRSCLERLRENARINALTNIRTALFAATTMPGELTVFVGDEPDILTSVASMTPNRYANTPITVPGLPLDDAEIPRPVGLIKIDAEGSESYVLDGARTTLAEDRPVVLIEVNDI